VYGDTYVGPADALVALGLVEPHQFPGAPGMRKTRVTIYADGTVATCAPNANDPRAKEPGAKWVHRAGRTSFSVHLVGLSEAESELRAAAHHEATRRWHQAASAVPVPARLRPVHADRAQALAKAGAEAAADASFQRFLDRLL
jgi:hypothetical protein